MYCLDKNLVQQTMFLFSRPDKIEQSKSISTPPFSTVLRVGLTFCGLPVSPVEMSPEGMCTALSVPLEPSLELPLANKQQSPMLV